jgi:hypothetical protein
MITFGRRSYDSNRVSATAMKLDSGGWTVYFETKHAFGAVGWGMTAPEAAILATRIELGEVPV